MYYDLEAIILRREDFRENDLLVTVYSRGHGRIKLQARGAKRIKSKLAGHLEPVNLCLLSVVKGRLFNQLIGAETVNFFVGIKYNLIKLAYASYMIELVDRLVGEGQKDEKVYELLRKGLEYLNKIQDTRYNKQESPKLQNLSSKQISISNVKYPIIRIVFGFKLLDLLGFNPREKKHIGLKDEIDFMVNRVVAEIINNQGIYGKLGKLNKILDDELKGILNQELKSVGFLRSMILGLIPKF